MIIKPKIRRFICTTAHPLGCAESVKRQIDYVKRQGEFQGPKKVLIIGASTGYGMASRIALAFGAKASTIGLFYEAAADGTRTATAGWYNTAAFEEAAHQQDLYATSINGDAFSNNIKQKTVDLIKADLGTVDCVIYSLASPRRIHPDTGEVFNSVLKPIGDRYTNITIDPNKGDLKEITLESANQDEINNTIEVMGGDDWRRWINVLVENDCLSEECYAVAYNYIGPQLTYPIYTDGTIGQAKQDLLKAAHEIDATLKAKFNGSAFISVNKALVTQASSAIPVVPLYISILYKIMKAEGTHEGCIEQMYRLFCSRVSSAERDKAGQVRIDDWEMNPLVQQGVEKIWDSINAENCEELTDLQGYRDEFHHLFGFGWDNVDYDAEVEPNVSISSIKEEPT